MHREHLKNLLQNIDWLRIRKGEEMFQINLRSPQSIYEQIVGNIKELIVRGVLEEDSELPSIRELSRSLTVNPNTVQKAFKELEREGFIYKVKGRGTFVSPRHETKIDPAAVKKISADIRNSVQELCYLGLPQEEIRTLVAGIADDPFAETKTADGAAKASDNTEETADGANAAPRIQA